MIKAEVLHPSRLAADDRALWRAWCEADPRFSNPLLGPEFAEAVGPLRPDARVALLDLDGERAGYFAYHSRGGGVARPIGAPFSDYSAVIVRPGVRLSGADILAATGQDAFRYMGLIDPEGAFDGVRGRDEGFQIRVGEGGSETYLETLQQSDPKRFKNWRRLTNKLEREAGPVVLTGPDHDPAAFDLLLRWKSDQLLRSGLHDFLAPPWVAQLMRNLFDLRDGPMRGLMVTLRAGDRLLAGHFGIVAGGHYHSWIASMDPEGGAWSPGQTFLFQAISAMPHMGLHTYDLARGHGHYKAPFCNSRQTVFDGAAVAPTAAGRWRAATESAWGVAGRAAPATARLRRRLDHLSDIEPTVGGRVKGLIDAVAAQGRRRAAGRDS